MNALAPAPPQRQWRHTVARRLRVLTALAALGLTLPLWAHALPGETLSWLGDLAVHWQWLYAVIGTVAGALWCALAAGHQRRWAVASVLLLGLGIALIAFVVPLPALPSAPAGAEGPSLRVVSFNVNLDNQSDADILAWIDTQRPDVVALLEVTPAMQTLLSGMAQRFAHHAAQASADPFGMAVYSRLPWQDAGFVNATDETPLFSATVAGPTGPFKLRVIHPMPPVSAAYRAQRDALLARWGAEPHAASGSLIVGDFNSTPWSAGLRRLGDAGWARATSLAPSYALLRVLPIDHILATRDHWRVSAHGRGPWLGSDHRPVWAVLRPPTLAAP